MYKPFHIYRSSAGSGKTRTLAKEYILLALRHPEYFKYTLAVTFANKSAQEMKDRIIRYLGEFSKGEGDDLGKEIQQALILTPEELKEKSKETLSKILHQYSRFSIGTIDAFFQQVIRAFTRESGLLGNFRLESENDRVMEEVIAGLIDELGPEQPQLTDWVIQFSKDKLVEGENWNITDALKGFSKELFKENYKAIADDIEKVQATLDVNEFLKSLRKEESDFMNVMRRLGERAMQIINSEKITSADFSYGEVGTAWKYFKQFSDGIYAEAKARVLSSAADANDWGKKGPGKVKLTQLAQSRLMPILNEMISFDKANYVRYNTARIIEENFYSYGLLRDITRKLNEYKAENNIMLLSDASHFLNGVIGNSDTPFIYEKVGSFYRHYLIDEFQDTSGLQWNNFKPLIRESLDQNHKSLVVGDVKQSIYRWRGSDLGLLQEIVEQEIGTERTDKTVLNDNWRSAEHLVNFNNLLFAQAALITEKSAKQKLPAEVFADVTQNAVKFSGQGFVSVQFLEKWGSREEGEGEDLALQMIPGWLEKLQAKGVAPGEITILVRKNWEGQKIADFLMRFRSSPQAKSGVNYDVISNESLRLDAASSVLLLLSALRYLNNPDDAVARGELAYESAAANVSNDPVENERRFSEAGRRTMHGLLPEAFLQQTHWLVRLSLFELTETLIRIFNLNQNKKELTYLQSFQDVILEFGGRDKNDIASFLVWWEEIKNEKSVQSSSGTNAASIFTIHKAKGLQFKYVIIPFCSWSMSHERPPLLWTKLEEAPYSTLGYTPVRFKSELEDSYFAPSYQEEFTKAHLDNLNLLYVAFTRAEEGMIVIAPGPGDKGPSKISNVGVLLHTAILQSPLHDQFNAAAATYSVGEIEVLASRKKDDSVIPVRLENYASIDWRRNLVIRRNGQEFFEEQSDARKRVNYGILMHSALSRIFYKGDTEEVLRNLNFEGLITHDERQPLIDKINEMMDDAVIGSWFEKEWNVRTETPVILPGGKIARIDRVISRDVKVKGQQKRKAIIIDYKTGERKKSDRVQVEEYAAILSSMGYSDVEGFLLYVDDLEVVRVMDKMNLELF